MAAALELFLDFDHPCSNAFLQVGPYFTDIGVRLLSGVVRHGRLVVGKESLAAFLAGLFMLTIIEVLRLLVVWMLAVGADC